MAPPQCEEHGDRLLRVEDSIQDTSNRISKVEATIGEGFAWMREGLAELKQSQDKILDKLDKQAERLDNSEIRLVPLEQDKKSREASHHAKMELAKKFFIAALIATVGFFVPKSVGWMLSILK